MFTFPAGVIQLVECQLPKLDVAGSSPVARFLLITLSLWLGVFFINAVVMSLCFLQKRPAELRVSATTFLENHGSDPAHPAR